MTNGTSPTRLLNWVTYHSSVRRIVAKFNPVHGNYHIHGHEFVEIVLIAGGTCLHQTAVGNTRTRPGDVFLFRRGAWHGYSEAKKLSLYNCCFDSALLGQGLKWMEEDPHLHPLLWTIPLSPKQKGMVSLHLSPTEYQACKKILDQLCALGKEDYLSHYGDHLGFLIQLLCLLARNIISPSKKKIPPSHTAVIHALELMNEHLTESWTLTSLAKKVHVEPTYFVRLFGKIVGVSPMAYLTRRRLEHAANLLTQSNNTIGEIGFMSGWVDMNYFSRCFRQHFKMTPSRYREKFQRSTGL